MNAPAADRRRRRRRVPDGMRKRAPRACTHCKARKSKCIETSRGICQRCMQSSLNCEFERQRSSVESELEITHEAQISPSTTFAADTPAERFMWPRFLHKLRETLSLEEVSASEAQSSTLPPVHQPRHTPDSARRVRVAARAFPPQAVARFLVSVCNEHGTDSFHYFDTAQFSAELDEFYANADSPSRLDSAFVCLAHATFALGSQWATLVRPEGSITTPPPQDSDPGRIFYQQARSLIPDIIELSSVRTVQATFVIGVYLLPASAISSSYVYLGLALRKSLAIDLHLEVEEVSINETERELRRRLWWAVYSLERCTTVKLSRPRSVDTAIITVNLPSPLPALDAQQAFNNVDHQLANAQLMMILDRVDGSMTTQGPVTGVETALKQWKRSLPPTLKLELIHPRISSYRATFHLYLNYYFARIAMGKVSVVARVRSYLKNHFSGGSHHNFEKHSDHLAEACIKASKKILRLYEDVRRTGNLTRFSFTDFQGCSVATSLMLLAGILERDSDYERHVNFGLDSLRKMAEGNATATAGLKFVEALQSIAEEAVQKLYQHGVATTIATATQDFRQTSDYGTWADWLARQPRQANSMLRSGTQTPLDLGGSSMISNGEPVMEFASWDGAAALQQLSSVPPLIPPSGGLQYEMNAASTDTLDPAMFMTDYSEDPMFLMGLTGFDMMGFGLHD
ncbi:uncharacterized protein M421DRAFT_425108 [Didymella exigua CBS 183.55]|uniref:Zn(2)-C6 fungal-type domain-containing protein n=1 Tax=Didymella exigua CBS 183.55 TaxID=1150837 RepID=A0A6A5R7F2_9PLEO|nr:uncharacterized protein M421DRAFT_425108 [Didymella exigua CBS 183.55]KAF1924095.1 hypothetical protein M421DRAFT_425108 [Didymella exigua CBS 183.55]